MKKILTPVCILMCLFLIGCSTFKPDCVDALNESAYQYPVYDDRGQDQICPEIDFEKFDIVRSEQKGNDYYAEGTAYGKDRYCNYTVSAKIRFHKYDQGWEVENIEFGQLRQELYKGISEQGIQEWLLSSINTYISELDDYSFVSTRLNDSDMDGVYDEQLVDIIVSTKDNIMYQVLGKEIRLIYDYEPGHWSFGGTSDFYTHNGESFPCYLLINNNTYVNEWGERFQITSVPDDGIGQIEVTVQPSLYPESPPVDEWANGGTYTLLWNNTDKLLGENAGYTFGMNRPRAAGYYEYIWEENPNVGINFVIYPYDGVEYATLNGLIYYLDGQTEAEIELAKEQNEQYKIIATDGLGSLRTFFDQKEEHIEIFDYGDGIQENAEDPLEEDKVEAAIQKVNHIEDILGYVTLQKTTENQPADVQHDTDTEDYILPDSASVYLQEQDIAGFSKEKLELARNEIFARHGRKFRTERIRDYFLTRTWYQELYEPDEFDNNVDLYLNECELENVNTIVAYETKMGYR